MLDTNCEKEDASARVLLSPVLLAVLAVVGLLLLLLVDVLSSKLVEPVHGVLSVALVFVVQSSSILYPLLPDVGFTNVVRSGVSFVTSGPSCVCRGT